MDVEEEEERVEVEEEEEEVEKKKNVTCWIELVDVSCHPFFNSSNDVIERKSEHLVEIPMCRDVRSRSLMQLSPFKKTNTVLKKRTSSAAAAQLPQNAASLSSASSSTPNLPVVKSPSGGGLTPSSAILNETSPTLSILHATGSPTIVATLWDKDTTQGLFKILEKKGKQMKRDRLDQEIKFVETQPFGGITPIDEINIVSKPWERDDWDWEAETPSVPAVSAVVQSVSNVSIGVGSRKESVVTPSPAPAANPFPGVRLHQVQLNDPVHSLGGVNEGEIPNSARGREGFLQQRARMSEARRPPEKKAILDSEILVQRCKASKEEIDSVFNLFNTVNVDSLRCGHFAWDVANTMLEEVIVEGEKLILRYPKGSKQADDSVVWEARTPAAALTVSIEDEEASKKTNRKLTFGTRKKVGSHIEDSNSRPSGNSSLNDSGSHTASISATISTTAPVSKGRSSTMTAAEMANVKIELGLQRHTSVAGIAHHQPEDDLQIPSSSQVLQTYIGYLLAVQGRYRQVRLYNLRAHHS